MPHAGILLSTFFHKVYWYFKCLRPFGYICCVAENTDLLNFAREAGIILREIMEMEWILVVVRDFARFPPRCAFFIEYNGILGVLELIFAPLEQNQFKFMF